MRQNPQSVLAARRQFFGGEGVCEHLVPPPILRSWTRCVEHGLDIASSPRIEPITAGELRGLREHNEVLRRLCRPELEALHAEAEATSSIVVLSDASGMVLERLGSDDFTERAGRVALRPGVSWKERATGTNAIGTALVERRPIVVQGDEHYFEQHRILTCSAAPIYDPRQEIVAVLDLTGPAVMPQMHALGLVRLAVDQIEHRFFQQGFERCEVLRLHRDPALLETAREGVLVFDSGRLVAANRYGLTLLGLGSDALGHRRFGELFAATPGHFRGRGRLRTRRGDELHATMQPPQETAASVSPRRERVRSSAQPWLDVAALEAQRRAVKLIDAVVPVLLQGETGCGKEVFAREIHARSVRRDHPFVAVNCAAVPEPLIESELFGYAEGAFTGARRGGSRGLLREAEGGVLFLDEIGDMPLGLQARLLRVLQEREVTPLGAGRAVAVDFAVICATHRNLRDMVRRGTFRADLFFRIAQYTIDLRPVRALADRAGLVTALWTSLTAAAGPPLAPETLRLLAAYDWPGNFRELVATLHAISALAEPAHPVTPDLLPPEIAGRIPSLAPLAIEARRGIETCRLDDITLQTMRQALSQSAGNVSRAARLLGVNRSTLYRRLLNGSAET